MEIINKIKSQKNKKPIYHYTSQSGLIGIIRNKSIWATDIFYLNDAQEFNYALDLLRDELQWLLDQINRGELGDIEKEGAFAKQIYELINLSIREPILDYKYHVFVCSFSEKDDLLSQWRAYCPNGSGFSIGFTYSQLQNAIEKYGFWLSKCIYNREDQKNAIKNLIREWGCRYIEGLSLFSNLAKDQRTKELVDAIGDVSFDFIKAFIHLSPLLKHPSFSEEKEWRLISAPISINHLRVRWREGSSMIIPYFDCPLHEDESMEIDAVTVGPTAYQALSVQSVEAFLHAEKVKFRKLKSSDIPFRDW